MQGTVNNTNLELNGVVGRERILHHEPVIHHAADGLGIVAVAQTMEAGVERNRVPQHRIGRRRRHMRAQQRSHHKLTVDAFQVVDLHIIIMGIAEAERRQGIAVVETQVAIAISIGERDDALSAEGAVGIEQVSEALVSKLGFDGILNGFLASHLGQKKQSDEILVFHCYRLRR